MSTDALSFNLYELSEDKTTPIPVEKPFSNGDVLTRIFSDTTNRRVASSMLPRQHCTVSTVFLGMAHGHDRNGRPLLWETMVFGGRFNQHMLRCSGTRADAQVMHNKVIEIIQKQTMLTDLATVVVQQEEHRRLTT